VKGWLTLALGLLAVVIGALWTLQGLGYVGGSVMTGQRLWAVVGPVVAAVGLLALGLALRARRRRTGR
jgi:MYXO-CTERM domain-containing protein